MDLEEMDSYPHSPGLQGLLYKRKDFIGVDKLATSHPNRTYYYRKDFDLDNIVVTCTKKLMMEPSDLKALILRGNAFMKKSLYDNAIIDFTAALKTEPYNTECLYNRGIAFSKVGKEEQAIRDLSIVLSENPNHVSAAFTRATCFNAIGQFSEAIEDYNIALQEDQHLNLLKKQSAISLTPHLSDSLLSSARYVPRSPRAVEVLSLPSASKVSPTDSPKPLSLSGVTLKRTAALATSVSTGDLCSSEDTPSRQHSNAAKLSVCTDEEEVSSITL